MVKKGINGNFTELIFISFNICPINVTMSLIRNRVMWEVNMYGK